MTGGWDAIIIGAGHNGLVCGFYLARAGKRVLMLERRGIVGGAAVTEEFHPGFRNSTNSYVVSYLRPEVIADMRLRERGFQAVALTHSLSLLPDGDSLLLTGDAAHDQAEVARFSNSDWTAMERLNADRARICQVLDRWLMRPPPRATGVGLRDLLGWGRLARDVLALPQHLRMRFIQMFSQTMRQVLDAYLSSPVLKAQFAGSAIAGFMAESRQPGSAFRIFGTALGQLNGKRGRWGIVRGGMGAITQSMAEACREAGVEIRTDAPVDKVLLENGRAVGVTLADGTTERASVVVSNADPKRTFLSLLPAGTLPEQMATDLENYRMESGSVRMSLALSELPDFTARPGSEPGPQHQGAIDVMPSMDYIDAAYRDCRAGRMPEQPIVHALIPTVHDDTLAPAGKHVMTITGRFFPYTFADGRSWDEARHDAADRIIDTLAAHAPNLKSAILGWKLVGPADLEREYGLTGGDVFHGQYDAAQLFSFRPHPKAADYATPVPALWLCGAGTHPGGGVSGANGWIAAHEILKRA